MKSESFGVRLKFTKLKPNSAVVYCRHYRAFSTSTKWEIFFWYRWYLTLRFKIIYFEKWCKKVLLSFRVNNRFERRPLCFSNCSIAFDRTFTKRNRILSDDCKIIRLYFVFGWTDRLPNLLFGRFWELVFLGIY